MMKFFRLRLLNNEFKSKVLPFLRDEDDRKNLIDKISYMIELKLSDLPF